MRAARPCCPSPGSARCSPVPPAPRAAPRSPAPLARSPSSSAIATASRAFSFAPRCPIRPFRAQGPQRASSLSSLALSSSTAPRRHVAVKAKDGTDESTDAPQTKKEEEEEFGYSGLGALSPDDRVALQPVGELFTKSKWREAIELCKQLMQTRDKRIHPLLYVTIADAYSALNNHSEALRAYASAVLQEPTYGEAHFRMGLVYFTLAETAPTPDQRNDMARRCQESLKLATRYLPDEPAAPHTLGQLYTTVIRNPTEALKCANEALRRDDQFAPAFLLKANSLIRREEWAAAIVELNKFYDKFPAFFKAQKFAPPAAQVLSETVVKRASCYVKIGEYAMAENDYKAVIELPDAPLQHKVFAYNGRGGIRFNKKDYWKAIDDHSEAIRIAPRVAESYKLRAIAYDSVAKSAEAEKDRQMHEYLERERTMGPAADRP